MDNVTLDIYKGELFTILGGSGCGKSTLLRMLAGFEVPSAGQIIIDGVDMANIPAYDRPINMMFQSYAVFPHMSVYKNMAFGLENAKLPKAEIDEIAKLLQLEDLMDRRPSNLSGGQRQRVAIGRALIRNPEVFLFDEPLSNLDAKLRVQMRLEIAKKLIGL